MSSNYNIRLSAREVQILRHAIGYGKKSDRNFFDPGEDDKKICEKLEEMGLMQTTKNFCGQYYFVTDAGKIAIKHYCEY